MNIWQIIYRNLCYYWRTQIGVFSGAVIAAAVLTGAMMVGDSVSFSLHSMVSDRLGNIEYSMGGQNRFFRAQLADTVSNRLGAPVASVLKIRGMVIHPDSGKRSSHVQVLGVDQSFWNLGNASPPQCKDDEIILNQSLARKLGLSVGDAVLLRVEKPNFLSQEAPLSLDEDNSTSQRMNIKAILGESEFGRFSLQPNQITPYNAFVPLDWMGEKIDLPNRANLLLVGKRPESELTKNETQNALRQSVILEDFGLTLREIPEQNQIELRSKTIFLNSEIQRTALRTLPGGIGAFSYFVNSIENATSQTPYSIVTALGALEDNPIAIPVLPQSIKDNEIVINQWLADDLNTQPGDTLTLKYFVMGSGRKLQEVASTFSVKSIIPMTGLAIDANWMPDFPGLHEKDNCREWTPGVDIDLQKIRKTDEDYWSQYKGSPKAFLSLDAGQSMWNNRFGQLTSIRWPLTDVTKQTLEQNFVKELYLPRMGFFFQPVRDQGFSASSQALDFGSLFIGLSFFLIVAALVLMGLLFSLGMEQRAKDIGVLSALGFTWKSIIHIFFYEGFLIAASGSFFGVLLSVLYTRVMIFALNTFWSGAIAGSKLHYHSEISTFVIGWIFSLCMAALMMWFVLRKFSKREIRNLLDQTAVIPFQTVSNNHKGLYIAIAALALALGIITHSLQSGRDLNVGAFFGAGMLLLISGISFIHELLFQRARASSQKTLSLYRLGILNASRKSSRSLGIVIVLSCASFLVFSVSANLKNPLKNAHLRSSGTGGFALLGESTLPVMHDLNTAAGQDFFGLDKTALARTSFVQLRVREGGDASCLNLNRVSQPRVMGVAPKSLETRGAFAFLSTIEKTENPWSLLQKKLPNGRIPAIADQGTLQWGLYKKIGDAIEYIDDNGETFEIQFVGALKSSLLQGSVFISEDSFIQRFPSEEGYRIFLVDATFDQRDAITELLEKAGRNIGLEITPAEQRLAKYYMIEKTYLSIFLLLGGLGMILGCVGLANVLLRNVLERRGELALLQAVGMTRFNLGCMLLIEHAGLLVMGMTCGTLAALIAVIPALRSLGGDLPLVALGCIMLAIIGNGLLWIWLASRLATRSSFLDALRNE